MLSFYILLAFVVSALTSAVVLPWLLRLSKKRGLYDMPNERKLHNNKIPRIGGVVFFPSVLITAVVVLTVDMYMDVNPDKVKTRTVIILAGVSIIYLIGVLDDILGLNAKFKFVIQTMSAIIMPFCDLYINNLHGLFGLYELPVYIGWPLTVFMILLLVNSMNLIDGIDGLSSSLALISLTAFALFCFNVHYFTCSLLAVSLLASVFVFMCYNLFGDVERGTKTFMGDAGSLILGYTMAFLVVKYGTSPAPAGDIQPFVISFTLVIVPMFDLVRVAFTRLAQRKSIFAADKQHIHHLCLDAGMSMRQALYFIVALQLLFCVVNRLMCLAEFNINLIVLADIVVFALVIYALSRYNKTSK